jgi:hypothetical protein
MRDDDVSMVDRKASVLSNAYNPELVRFSM